MKLAPIAAIATTLIGLSCQSDESTRITANLGDLQTEQAIIFSIAPTGIDALDTVAVTDGNLESTLELDSADFILLQASEKYNVPLFIQPGEKVDVKLTGTVERPSYVVEGSEESKRLQMITDIMIGARDRIDSLNTASEEIMTQEAMNNDPQINEKKNMLDAAFKRIMTSTANQYKAMIDENPGSVANIFIFSQALGKNAFLNSMTDFEYFTKVDEALDAKYPDLKHTKNFHASITNIAKSLERQKAMEAASQNIKEGMPVPNIEMTDVNGAIRQLADLKGKVVLIDFWAAWCRPCRAENPNVVKLYNQYKDQGFDVFSVSLDGLPQQQDPKAEWLEAIQQDGLVWENHVSELTGWETSVVDKFAFQGIPFTVLVGRDGNIVATRLRGPELEAKVKELIEGNS